MRVVNSLFLIVILLSSAVVGPLSLNSDIVPESFAQVPLGDVTDIGSYVIYGLEKVEIKENVTIQSGNIGLHDDSNEKGEIKIKEGISFTDPEFILVGNKIKIEAGATVQNVFYNILDNQGTILGIESSPLSLPVVEELPFLPDAEFGRCLPVSWRREFGPM